MILTIVTNGRRYVGEPTGLIGAIVADMLNIGYSKNVQFGIWDPQTQALIATTVMIDGKCAIAIATNGADIPEKMPNVKLPGISIVSSWQVGQLPTASEVSQEILTVYETACAMRPQKHDK